MKSRAFNKVDVNYFTNTIIKSSENKVKLKDEISYYLNIPTRIRHYFPQLQGYEHDFSAYTLEYVPYKTLCELFLSDKLTFDEGKKITQQLLLILEDFHSYKESSTVEHLLSVYEFYINKTLERVEEFWTFGNRA